MRPSRWNRILAAWIKVTVLARQEYPCEEPDRSPKTASGRFDPGETVCCSQWHRNKRGPLFWSMYIRFASHDPASRASRPARDTAFSTPACPATAAAMQSASRSGHHHQQSLDRTLSPARHRVCATPLKILVLLRRMAIRKTVACFLTLCRNLPQAYQIFREGVWIESFIPDLIRETYTFFASPPLQITTNHSLSPKS